MYLFRLKQLLARTTDAAISLDTYLHERRDRYVLSYHRIIPAEEAQREGVHFSMWMSPVTLEAQIRWMQSVGRIVDYRRIMDFTEPADRPLFTLTFDDGWRDNYLNALPILRKYRVPALIFLATEAVGTGDLFWPQDIATKTQRIVARGEGGQVVASLRSSWPERSAGRSLPDAPATLLMARWIEELKLLNEHERNRLIERYFSHLHLSATPLTGYVMSWEEAREMHASGIEFGSHTHRHAILKGLPAEQIEEELRRSRSLIAKHLEIDADSFCYPNGWYNGTEGAMLSRSGYRYAFSLDSRSLRYCADAFYIPRFVVSETAAGNAAYFKLCLMSAPLFRPKAYDPSKVRRRHDQF